MNIGQEYEREATAEPRSALEWWFLDVVPILVCADIQFSLILTLLFINALWLLLIFSHLWTLRIQLNPVLEQFHIGSILMTVEPLIEGHSSPDQQEDGSEKYEIFDEHWVHNPYLSSHQTEHARACRYVRRLDARLYDEDIFFSLPNFLPSVNFWGLVDNVASQ